MATLPVPKAPARALSAPVRRLLVLAGAVIFLDSVFYTAITPLLPGYVRDLDIGEAGAGVLTASYATGTFLAALPAAWLAGRIGVRRTVIFGLALLAAASVAFGFAGSALALDSARFLQGVGGACSWAATLAWLVHLAPRERRGELIGTTFAAAVAGSLLGPGLGAMAAAGGGELPFAGVAVLAVGLAIAALSVPGVTATRPRLASLRPALRDRGVAGGLWLTCLFGLSEGAVTVLAPLQLDAAGAGSLLIAAVFFAAAFGELVVTPIAGRLSDRLGRIAPVRFGLPLGVALVVLVALEGPLGWQVALLVAAIPVLSIGWAPGTALLADGAERRRVDYVLTFALSGLAWSFGQLSGASGAGALASLATAALPWGLLAGTLAATWVLAMLVRIRGAQRLGHAASANPTAGEP